MDMDADEKIRLLKVHLNTKSEYRDKLNAMPAHFRDRMVDCLELTKGSPTWRVRCLICNSDLNPPNDKFNYNVGKHLMSSSHLTRVLTAPAAEVRRQNLEVPATDMELMEAILSDASSPSAESSADDMDMDPWSVQVLDEFEQEINSPDFDGTPQERILQDIDIIQMLHSQLSDDIQMDEMERWEEEEDNDKVKAVAVPARRRAAPYHVQEPMVDPNLPMFSSLQESGDEEEEDLQSPVDQIQLRRQTAAPISSASMQSAPMMAMIQSSPPRPPPSADASPSPAVAAAAIPAAPPQQRSPETASSAKGFFGGLFSGGKARSREDTSVSIPDRSAISHPQTLEIKKGGSGPAGTIQDKAKSKKISDFAAFRQEAESKGDDMEVAAIAGRLAAVSVAPPVVKAPKPADSPSRLAELRVRQKRKLQLALEKVLKALEQRKASQS